VDGNHLERRPVARSYKGDLWRKSLSSTYPVVSGKGNQVDRAGATREGDTVRHTTKEVGLTETIARFDGTG
jgi:hypothetical protein